MTHQGPIYNSYPTTLTDTTVYSNVTHGAITGKRDIISDELLELIVTLTYVAFGSIVSFFGMVSNVFNVVVFVKQGLGDTVNIGLMGLAIADLCSLFTLELMSIIRNPAFYKSLDIDVDQFQHLTVAWPHVTFARVSSWITAYIMLERCLCVVVPLRIKTIITPRVTVSAIVSIFVFMFLTLVPDYATCYIAWRFDPGRNRSILGLLFLEHREEMAAVTFNISAGTQLSSFGAVIFFTAILVLKMKQKSKWRSSTSSHGQDSSKKDTSNRDQKTIKMIILVAVIYCACFLPMLCECIATSLIPGFIIFGDLSNSFVAFWSIALMLDAVNSSVNIFVYYKMSTKYRTTFDTFVLRRKIK